MNTWKVILATLVIFGAGLVTGALLVRNAQRGPFAAVQPQRGSDLRPDSAARGTSPPSSGPHIRGMRKEFLKNLDQELQLTAEQRERIEKILCDGQECTKQLWDKVEPEVRAEWKRVKAAIRAILTEEQQKKFDEFMMRSHKQEERRLPQSGEDQKQKGEISEPTPVDVPAARP